MPAVRDERASTLVPQHLFLWVRLTDALVGCGPSRGGHFSFMARCPLLFYVSFCLYLVLVEDIAALHGIGHLCPVSPHTTAATYLSTVATHATPHRPSWNLECSSDTKGPGPNPDRWNAEERRHGRHTRGNPIATPVTTRETPGARGRSMQGKGGTPDR